jgi:glycosyltransferase involved in cell wall biosynthesis
VSRPDVVLLAPYPPAGQRHAGSSGVASYTANLARALAAEGARVAVVAPEQDGEPQLSKDGAITVRRCYRPGPRALPIAARAALDTGAPTVHVQHEHFLYGGLAALPGLGFALARLGRAAPRTVITLHQVVDPGVVDRAYVAMHRIGVPAPLARLGLTVLQRSLVAMADAAVVHEAAFTQILPGSTLIPHGVELVQPGDRRHARAQLRLDDDRLVVLCFGFLAPYKGLELALEAAKLAGGEVLLVVAGGEHPRLAGRDPYAADLQRRWGSTARFTGYVPETQVGPWHAAADVALLCYPEPHASSGALALAIAHGTPFLLSPRLAHQVGASPSATVPLDPALIAARCKQLASDRQALAALRATCSHIGRDRAWPVVACRHIALYKEISRVEHRAGGRLWAA